MASLARAGTGFSLQDFADSLPLLPQATLYTARKVISMDAASPVADAVAVVGDRVLFVGPRAEVAARLGDQPFTQDDRFEGKVILAGMIDQHVHPVLAALTMTLEIIAIEDWVLPTGTAKAALNAEDYMARLTAAEAALQDPAEPLITWGYHHYFHGLVRRAQLEAISAARPIVVWHRSAHEVILNSAALTLLGITADLVAALPAAALAQTSFEDGYFYETGFFAIMPKLAPLLATPERLTAGLELTRDYLHRSGVTVACEPGGVLSRPLQEVQNKILGGSDVPFRMHYIPDGKSLAALYAGPEMIAQTAALMNWGARAGVVPADAGQAVRRWRDLQPADADARRLHQRAQGRMDHGTGGVRPGV